MKKFNYLALMVCCVANVIAADAVAANVAIATNLFRGSCDMSVTPTSLQFNSVDLNPVESNFVPKADGYRSIGSPINMTVQLTCSGGDADPSGDAPKLSVTLGAGTSTYVTGYLIRDASASTSSGFGFAINKGYKDKNIDWILSMSNEVGREESLALYAAGERPRWDTIRDDKGRYTLPIVVACRGGSVANVNSCEGARPGTLKASMSVNFYYQ
ncbi:hypothetical protein [Serratia microhaemolytica]|uniref:hypothetical protein n=1 Tax=Serratia microhaemolytica TaxID=2675110 RepID=UPI000FDD48FF|nr:hypothetical protein [Serratia microhaemolytica]